MSFAKRSARRRGMFMGAAIAKSRAKSSTPTATPTAPQPAPPVVDHSEAIAQVKQLAELRDQGILTEEEFTAKKKQLLDI